MDDAAELLEGLVVVEPADLVSHHDAHPLALRALLRELYGRVWITWEPETLWIDLQHIFHRPVSDLSKTKIQAIKSMESHRGFWAMWEIWVPIALGLNNRIPSPNILIKPTVPQCYVATDIAAKIDKFPYSTEIARYIAAIFADAGIDYAPKPLDFIQRQLDQPMYQCMDCGNVDADENNRLCDNCGGTNLRRYNRAGLSEGEKQLVDKIISDGHAHVLGDENRIDVLGAKLKVAIDYMNFRRAQLDEQLAILRRAGAKLERDED